MNTYLWRNLKALDQGLNALLYPVLNPLFNTDKFGSEDELISSVLGKLIEERNRLALIVCKLLNKIDKGHCAKSIERDE